MSLINHSYQNFLQGVQKYKQTNYKDAMQNFILSFTSNYNLNDLLIDNQTNNHQQQNQSNSKFLQLNFPSYQSLVNISSCLIKQKEYQIAQQTCYQLIKINPLLSIGYYNLASISIKQQQYSKAYNFMKCALSCQYLHRYERKFQIQDLNKAIESSYNNIQAIKLRIIYNIKMIKSQSSNKTKSVNSQTIRILQKDLFQYKKLKNIYEISFYHPNTKYQSKGIKTNIKQKKQKKENFFISNLKPYFILESKSTINQNDLNNPQGQLKLIKSLKSIRQQYFGLLEDRESYFQIDKLLGQIDSYESNQNLKTVQIDTTQQQEQYQNTLSSSIQDSKIQTSFLRLGKRRSRQYQNKQSTNNDKQNINQNILKGINKSSISQCVLALQSKKGNNQKKNKCNTNIIGNYQVKHKITKYQANLIEIQSLTKTKGRNLNDKQSRQSKNVLIGCNPSLINRKINRNLLDKKDKSIKTQNSNPSFKTEQFVHQQVKTSPKFSDTLKQISKHYFLSPKMIESKLLTESHQNKTIAKAIYQSEQQQNEQQLQQNNAINNINQLKNPFNKHQVLVDGVTNLNSSIISILDYNDEDICSSNVNIEDNYSSKVNPYELNQQQFNHANQKLQKMQPSTQSYLSRSKRYSNIHKSCQNLLQYSTKQYNKQPMKSNNLLQSSYQHQNQSRLLLQSKSHHKLLACSKCSIQQQKQQNKQKNVKLSINLAEVCHFQGDYNQLQVYCRVRYHEQEYRTEVSKGRFPSWKQAIYLQVQQGIQTKLNCNLQDNEAENLLHIQLWSLNKKFKKNPPQLLDFATIKPQKWGKRKVTLKRLNKSTNEVQNTSYMYINLQKINNI